MKAYQYAVMLCAFLCTTAAIAASTINSTNRYAYSANAGWIDCLAETNNGAVVGLFICEGYLYSANIGWIHLGDGSPTNKYSYSNLAAGDYGVNHDGQGNLRGCAYGANIGWVNFEDSGAPSVDLLTGKLSGFVYSANAGWISLSNAQAYVQIDSLDPGPDIDTDGLPDLWEYTYAVSVFTMSGGTGDYDGDGILNTAEFIAGTDPTVSNDLAAVTDISISGANASLTWQTTPVRVYTIEKNFSITNSSGWTDSGLGVMTADSSNTTTRVLSGAASSTNATFYKTKAHVPLQ